MTTLPPLSDTVVDAVPGFDIDPGPDGYALRYHPDPSVDSSLRAAMADLDAMDPTKRFRSVLYVDQNGAQAVAMARIAKGWSVAGIVQKGWTEKQPTVGIEVRFEI